MKITEIETILLRLPEVLPNGDGLQDLLVLQVHTDAGITGIGEVHTAPLVAKAIIDAPVSQLTVQGFRQLLIGRDPRRITELWHLLYEHSSTMGRRGVVINVLSGFDIALWDILGKLAELPLYQLLGGAFRDSLPAYASDLMPDSREEILACARARVAEGYRAMKLGWGALGRDLREDVARVGELRRAVGPAVDIMLDMGMPLPLEQAIWLGDALAEHEVAFLEEPLSPDDLDGFQALTARSRTPIATGEKETTRFGFRDLMERGGLRIIQPDIARVGGLTEARRIAALAEVRNVSVIPHCWASDILVSATLHFLAAQRHAPYLEYNVMDNPLRRDLLLEPIRPQNGMVAVPDGLGLGIELNEETLERYRWDG